MTILDLTPKELGVWAAVYAASWVEDFRNCEEAHGFDHLASYSHAERACDMADLAVRDLRDWESQLKGE